MTAPPYLIIGGGSFQGKSLAALHAAHLLGVPAIVCTDTVRNVLATLQTDTPSLGTSTYLLTAEELGQQMNAVSGAVLATLDIFRSRGERCIIEGMHLTRPAIRKLAASGDALLLCLDNQAAFRRRIDAKATTRRRLNKDRYLEHRARIVEIHAAVVRAYRAVEAPVLRFDTLDGLRARLDEVLHYLV